MAINLEPFKQQAAERALALVESGMRVGLGSGSTARYVVEGLGARLHDRRLYDVVGVPTSDATAALAQAHGVPLSTLDAMPALDIAIDGADEIDPQLTLIKGLGGALLREKIVASAAKQFIVVADASKIVQHLGERAPVPVEVITFGVRLIEQQLRALGAKPTLRLAADGTPFVTDEGNSILDCRFAAIPEPAVLGAALHAIAGVVEHGLFVQMAQRAFVASAEGVRDLIAN